MTKPLKVLDCFSGIGGFALAESFFEGQFETKQFVEINSYCQQVLSKNFKGVPIHDDIKTFTAPRGSFESQPLDFPAKISVLEDNKKELEKELDQDYFTSAFGYLGKFDLSSPSLKTLEIYSPLKKGGYSKKSSFKLPKQGMMLNGQLFQQEMWEAVTFENVWIIAYPKHNGSSTPKRLRFNDKTNSGTQKRQNKISQPERGCESQSSKTIQRATTTQTTNSNIKGLEGLRGEHELQESCGEEKARWSTQPYTLRPDWRGYDSEPCLPRRDDGVSSRMDANWRNRKERIICLGNAVTPQQAAIPLGRIIDLIKS